MTRQPALLLSAAIATSLAGWATTEAATPPVQRSPALPAVIRSCAELPTRFSFPQTSLQGATVVPGGTASVAGRPIGTHCLVTGKMNERVSPVDGQTYAIGFEMRLPAEWNGRFLYQGNGGIDGAVVPAFGAVNGGAAATNALAQGFAVISSDAGHSGRQNPLFGLDPQARLDYGYQAVGSLTPMAKALIRSAYDKDPDYSYIGGCSNGGRHVLVAAARYADQYDGFLAGDPGFNLPQAALAQLYAVQQYSRVTTSQDLESGFTLPERQLVANAVLAKCDALDDAKDGLVQSTAQCQKTFNLGRDVPTCSSARDGACLTKDQKDVIGKLFAGVRDAKGKQLSPSFPFDAGIPGANWADWKFVASVTNRDPPAMAFIFQSPPAPASTLRDLRGFALGFDVNRDGPKIFATAAPYNEASMSFMTPPNATQMADLKRTGGKLLVYHGTSDPIFSSNDTAAWYDGLRKTNRGDARGFARYYEVPGMNHCRGGPSTDQFDMLTSLVNWVEKGEAPEAIVATARGAGNPAGVNPELPADWAADRSRPLCPYPLIARYDGKGDIEKAASFSCKRP
jgi:pimeloyl-ACP methyl ester carboxylesterase